MQQTEKYTEYVTKDAERWDNIAWKSYGDAGEINRIVEANPTVPITATLPAGVRLLVPIVETVAPEVDKNLLPPWKR